MARIIYAEDDESIGQILPSILATDGLIVGAVAEGYSKLQEIALKKAMQAAICDCPFVQPFNNSKTLPVHSGLQINRSGI